MILYASNQSFFQRQKVNSVFNQVELWGNRVDDIV